VDPVDQVLKKVLKKKVKQEITSKISSQDFLLFFRYDFTKGDRYGFATMILHILSPSESGSYREIGFFSSLAMT
jgi:hypothetical protein